MSRSLKKGFFVDPGLWKVVEAAVKADSHKPIRTWSRRSTITPEFVGLNFEIHNGKNFLPLHVTLDRTLLVFALTLGMCAISGLLAVRKVRKLDPAEVF